jgi:hypothetical protein
MRYIKLFGGSLALFLFSLMIGLQGTDGSSEPVKIIRPDHSSARDQVDKLKGYKSLTFFPFVPTSSVQSWKQIEKLAIRELEKLGKVVPKDFSVESLFSEETVKSGFFKNPALSYTVASIDDIDGKELPFLKVTLSLEVSVKIEKNKEYGRSALWSYSCYFQGNLERDVESCVSETLPLLLKQFKADYLKTNSKAPTIYFPE